MEDRRRKEEATEAEAVAAFVRKEVGDWDDEVISRARFKALSGLRSDWDPLYRFWRDLILKVARHLRIFIVRPSHVNRLWFNRDGLSPLCLDRVLLEMHRAGDLLLPNPNPPAASRLFNIFRTTLSGFWVESNAALAGDSYILAPLLEEQALEVIKILSENYWTGSCVVTMRKFEDFCRGSEEALAILGYFSAHGRAIRLTMNRADDSIQGVKVRLAPGAAVSTATSVDYTVLHLISTTEKLEQQRQLIDQRYQKSRNSATASLKAGNKRGALRYAAEMKLESQSRERCTTLLERVENVLQVITDAESSKKVFDAIQTSTHALKENKISVEEVEVCLQEVDDNIDSLKQLDKALASTTAYEDVEDDDVEDEFNKLQLDLGIEEEQVPPTKTSTGVAETADALSNALSNLDLKSDAEYSRSGNRSTSKQSILEAA